MVGGAFRRVRAGRPLFEPSHQRVRFPVDLVLFVGEFRLGGLELVGRVRELLLASRERFAVGLVGVFRRTQEVLGFGCRFGLLAQAAARVVEFRFGRDRLRAARTVFGDGLLQAFLGRFDAQRRALLLVPCFADRAGGVLDRLRGAFLGGAQLVGLRGERVDVCFGGVGFGFEFLQLRGECVVAGGGAHGRGEGLACVGPGRGGGLGRFAGEFGRESCQARQDRHPCDCSLCHGKAPLCSIVVGYRPVSAAMSSSRSRRRVLSSWRAGRRMVFARSDGVGMRERMSLSE